MWRSTLSIFFSVSEPQASSMLLSGAVPFHLCFSTERLIIRFRVFILKQKQWKSQTPPAQNKHMRSVLSKLFQLLTYTWVIQKPGTEPSYSKAIHQSQRRSVEEYWRVASEFALYERHLFRACRIFLVLLNWSRMQHSRDRHRNCIHTNLKSASESFSCLKPWLLMNMSFS